MALHATDSLEDAFEATKELLLPVTAATWLRLAVVGLFVGGMGGAPVTNFGTTGGAPPGGEVPGDPSDLLAAYLPYVVAAVAVVGLLGLLAVLVGSVMEFVFVEALATGEVSVRDRFRVHWGDGLRLFGFRLVLLFVALALVGGAVGLGFLLQGPGIRFLPLLFAAPVALVVAPVLGVVHGFTNAFVVPVMVREGVGVLAGWRRFWATLSADRTEFGVYLALSVVLGLIGGAAVATAVGVIAAIILVPMVLLGFVGLLGGAAAGLTTVMVLVAAGTFVLVAATVVLVATAVVKLPVVTYLRYYALFTLGGVDPELDLVGHLRAAATDDGMADGAGDGPADDRPVDADDGAADAGGRESGGDEF